MAPAQLSPGEAETLWREAVELSKRRKKRHQKKAITMAQRMIEEAPNTPETLGTLHCFIADCYGHAELGDYDRAVEHYLLALELNPGYSLAGSNLGHVLLRYKRDPEAAARILQQTLDRGVSNTFIRATTEDLLADARRELGSG